MSSSASLKRTSPTYQEVKRLTMVASPKNRILPLLNSRCFPLNVSSTKLITVGLKPQKAFDSCIRIQSQNFYGLCFSEKTWTALKSKFETIISYFNNKEVVVEEKIPCNEIVLTFTTSFGEKAIVLDETASEDISDGGDANNSPKKVFSPAIVLQKNSFEGLVKIAPCVDAYLENSIRLKDNISKLYDGVIEEIYSKFSEDRQISRDSASVRRYMESNSDEIIDKVSGNVDSVFRVYYLDAFYFELTALYSYGMANSVCKKLYADYEEKRYKRHLDQFSKM